jgi:hypothetical protein
MNFAEEVLPRIPWIRSIISFQIRVIRVNPRPKYFPSPELIVCDVPNEMSFAEEVSPRINADTADQINH